jgi:hypothetical protein
MSQISVETFATLLGPTFWAFLMFPSSPFRTLIDFTATWVIISAAKTNAALGDYHLLIENTDPPDTLESIAMPPR